MIDLYKPHHEISRTTSEITLLVFRAGLENAANFLFVLRANFRAGLENAANFLFVLRANFRAGLENAANFLSLF